MLGGCAVAVIWAGATFFLVDGRPRFLFVGLSGSASGCGGVGGGAGGCIKG